MCSATSAKYLLERRHVSMISTHLVYILLLNMDFIYVDVLLHHL